MNNGLDDEIREQAKKMIDKSRKVVAKAEKSMSSIVSVCILISCILAQFVVATINAQFDIEFFISLALSTALMLSVRFVWVADGKREGMRDEGYNKNKLQASTMVSEVYENKELTLLSEYASFASQQNKEDTIAAHLGNYAIDYNDYLDKYMHMTSVQINSEQTLSPHQKIAIMRIKNGKMGLLRKLKYPKLCVQQLTGGFTYYKVRHIIEKTETGAVIKTNILWTLAMIGVTFALQLLSPTAREHIDILSTIAQSVLWIISVLMSAIIGFNAGVRFITVRRNSYYISVIRNLSGFAEWKTKKQ